MMKKYYLITLLMFLILVGCSETKSEFIGEWYSSNAKKTGNPDTITINEDKSFSAWFGTGEYSIENNKITFNVPLTGDTKEFEVKKENNKIILLNTSAYEPYGLYKDKEQALQKRKEVQQSDLDIAKKEIVGEWSAQNREPDSFTIKFNNDNTYESDNEKIFDGKRNEALSRSEKGTYEIKEYKKDTDPTVIAKIEFNNEDGKTQLPVIYIQKKEEQITIKTTSVPITEFKKIEK